jgi:hypothetical protein
MFMGPWSASTPEKVRPQSSLRLADVCLIIALLALCAAAAAAIWVNRYEVATAGGLPARLNRFTGQVVGCIPGQGCVEIVPAGEPPLRKPVVAAPHPAPEGQSAGNSAPPAPPPAAS